MHFSEAQSGHRLDHFASKIPLKVVLSWEDSIMVYAKGESSDIY